VPAHKIVENSFVEKTKGEPLSITQKQAFEDSVALGKRSFENELEQRQRLNNVALIALIIISGFCLVAGFRENNVA